MSGDIPSGTCFPFLTDSSQFTAEPFFSNILAYERAGKTTTPFDLTNLYFFAVGPPQEPSGAHITVCIGLLPRQWARHDV